MKMTRRELLVAGAASVATLANNDLANAKPEAPAPIRVTAERRHLDVNGRAASVFALTQPDGTEGVSLQPGERFMVNLVNRAAVPTIIHWHGQTPPVRQDGVTQTGLESLIQPGASQGYDYAPRTGTHWMHSHHGLQEQSLMAAPLIVHSADDQRADVQDVVVMLHDFTFRDPREILAGLMKGGGSGMGDQAAQANMPGMSMGGSMPMGSAMPAGMTMGGHTTMPAVATPSGTGTASTGMVMDLNDINFDAYLANRRTLADPEVVRTERHGRVRLRLINGASSTAFWIDLGGAVGTIVAVDGDPIHPILVRRFPMAEAQRVDVLLTMPKAGGSLPIIAQREGGRARTGLILASREASIVRMGDRAAQAVGAVDLSLEQTLRAQHPLPRRPADVRHRVILGGSMRPYRWTIDGDAWPHHKPLTVRRGQLVELMLVNQSQMAHPMHLHGHHFQVLALNGMRLRGAMRDTVLVPANGTATVAFEAINPGRWLFHCHNLYHMAAGMMTEVVYTDFA